MGIQNDAKIEVEAASQALAGLLGIDSATHREAIRLALANAYMDGMIAALKQQLSGLGG